MIRMQRSKPRTKGTRMRKRRVTLYFTENEKAKGLGLVPIENVNCDCSEGILQSLPEREYILDEDGGKVNCNIADMLEVGCLKVDEGAKSFHKIYYLISKAGSFLLYMPDKKAFYIVATNRVDITCFSVKTEDGPKLALCTRKGFLLASLSGGYVAPIEDGTLAAGALFKHRIFVAMKGGVVKYSAPEDFTNFTESADEGGSIAFPHCGGEIVAMKAYDDALYVFFRSGIMRLKAGGEPSGFYAEQLDYTGGDIIPRTICVCQHAVYFLARTGVYRLKGKKTERLDINATLPTEETGLESCAVWKDQPMIQYQKKDGTFEVIVIKKNGRSVFFMPGLELLGKSEDGRVLFVDRLKFLSQLVDQGTHGENGQCLTETTDFGWVGKKQLECLRFYGEGTVDVGVSWGNVSASKHLEFFQGVAEWTFNRAEYGERFQLNFLLSRQSKVTSVQAEYKTFG